MKNKRAVYLTIFIVACIICAVCAVLIIKEVYSMKQSEKATESLRSEVKHTVSSVMQELPENPIDFTSLKKRNKDIYAWIEIPNTEVDYPIVQSYTEADSFYLDHNIDKNYDINGSIYTEKLNKKDFSDPNTLIYGHNMLDGSMFQNLHKFRDKKFFDENRYIYIYTKGHILKYEIVAAYKSDNRHILNSYDFGDPKVFAEYLKGVENPKSLECNATGKKLTTSDRLITLSTCIGNESNYRYLVQGVLIDDTITK